MGAQPDWAMAERAGLDLNDKAQLLEQYAPGDSPLIDLAKRFGPAAMDVVLDACGGEWLPEKASFWAGLARRVRDEQIRTAFRGNNISELAALHGLSERQVRRIVCDG